MTPPAPESASSSSEHDILPESLVSNSDGGNQLITPQLDSAFSSRSEQLQPDAIAAAMPMQNKHLHSDPWYTNLQGVASFLGEIDDSDVYCPNVDLIPGGEAYNQLLTL